MHSSINQNQRSPRIKLVIVTNMLAPYRIPLFENIHGDPRIDLHVIVNDIICPERSAWRVGEITFPYSLVKRKKLCLLSRKYDVPCNLVTLLSQLKPQITVASGFSPASILTLFYSQALGIPFIVWSGETRLSYHLGNRHPGSQYVRRLMVHLADGCLAYGPDAKEYLQSCGANDGKVWVINNICNAAPFLLTKRHPRKGPFADMLYVGELSERKNVHLLVSAYRQAIRCYPELRLTLVGGGDLQAALLEYRRKHLLNGLIIRGEVPSTDVSSIMARADFFILASRVDLWPHVVMEAMASGLPVLCSKNAGVPPYIVRDSENGFFFSPESELEIMDAIGKMMKKRGKWGAMGARSMEIVKEYSVERSAEAFRAAITETLMAS